MQANWAFGDYFFAVLRRGPAPCAPRSFARHTLRMTPSTDAFAAARVSLRCALKMRQKFGAAKTTGRFSNEEASFITCDRWAFATPMPTPLSHAKESESGTAVQPLCSTLALCPHFGISIFDSIFACRGRPCRLFLGTLCVCVFWHWCALPLLSVLFASVLFAQVVLTAPPPSPPQPTDVA